jgi:hypothetical protein
MIDVGTHRLLKMVSLQSCTSKNVQIIPARVLNLHDPEQAFLPVLIFAELSLGKSAPTCQAVAKSKRQESAQ